MKRARGMESDDLFDKFEKEEEWWPSRYTQSMPAGTARSCS